MPRPLLFAEASWPLEEALFVIAGVPFDRTASYRGGAREAPLEIRKASYNFEPYMYEYDLSLEDCPIHDMGDVDEMGSTEDMAIEVTSLSQDIVRMGKFPIIMGGEHSISPPAASGLASIHGEKMGIIVVDAHLDFRAEYMGDGNNHACASRRFADLVGAKRVFPMGVRSICREELEDARAAGLQWFTATEASSMSAEDAVSRAMERMGVKKLYLSIDIDGIDPAFAPGTGTPEPFGLRSVWVRDLIKACSPYLLGMDIVEVCPPVDNGNTSALAARLMREGLAGVFANGDNA